MLQLLAKFLKILNSDANPAQISLGLVAGMILGLTPLWSLHNLVLLFFVLILRINLAAFIAAWTAFSGIAYLFDPLMEKLGEALLTAPTLKVFWTDLYQMDLARLFHFNNTLTLGSFVISIGLTLPGYFLSNFIIQKYRQHLLAWVRKTNLLKLLKLDKFYNVYKRVSTGGAA